MNVFFYTVRKDPNEIRELAERASKVRADALARMREQQANEAKFGEKARKYLAAEARHAWGGPAPVEVFEQRLRLCMECPGRVDELEGKRDDGGVGFCTKCGCGANKRSQLSVKLTLAGVECPLGKFKKVEGTGGTIASAVEAAKGVAANAIDLMRNKFRNERAF
jgi:hypothetical protein